MQRVYAGGQPWNGLATHPGERGKTPSRVMLRDKLSSMSHLAGIQT